MEKDYYKMPPLTGESGQLIHAAPRRMVVLGANGAGKSRFARRLADDMEPGSVFELSALKALFDRDAVSSRKASVDALYAKAVESGMPTRERPNELERVMALVMRREMQSLLTYKVRHATDASATLPATQLDTVIAMWQELFPQSRIMVADGEMLFAGSQEEDDGAYSATKLSTGERAVLYYLAAITFAPVDATVIVDSPESFLHPSIMRGVWARVEQLRPDCRMVYVTNSLEFATSFEDAEIVWVRRYDAPTRTWDFEVLPASAQIPAEVFAAITGTRKPVLFIEGDGVHSIDSKLYPLVFKDYTVRSLGSCNKVIEATRAFNDLQSLHHMDSYGIVDRDRRDAHEVEYLRGKRVMVPDVAEIENILMLEEVIAAVARNRGRNAARALDKVRKSVIHMFASDLRAQALMHTRHRVKRMVEYRVDGRFTTIDQLEQHMRGMTRQLNPRGIYDSLCAEFERYVRSGDYRSILRVYNQKSMLPNSNVAPLCGLKNKEEYVHIIITILEEEQPEASHIREAVRKCFGLESRVNDEVTEKQHVNKQSKKNKNAKKDRLLD